MHGLKLKKKQSFNIAAITFWSQFAVYTFNSILILYLTKPVFDHGLGFAQSDAYAFQGVSQAMGYAIVMLGGYLADRYLGIRRSILLGSLLLAVAFLLVFLSGFLVNFSSFFFIAAYATIPACSSLLMGTSSAMVSKIYSDDKIHAKSAMTIYYLSINLGSIIAYIIAPMLIDYTYGPFIILAIVFVGKSISALNFAWRYKLYDNVVEKLDKQKTSAKIKLLIVMYLLVVYLITLLAYNFPNIASIVLGVFCLICLASFILRTFTLTGNARIKQVIAVILIAIAVVFFVIYNQMNSTLVLLAYHNSSLTLFGITVSAASYQLINPIIIIVGGYFISTFYQYVPKFTIPYQFAVGTLLSALGLIVIWFGFYISGNGIVNGNYIALSYFLISISELFVSAIGLSMIGLYCNINMIAFAMGAWFIAVSFSNIISGQVNQLVALPENELSVIKSGEIYQNYFMNMGMIVLIFGVFFTLFAWLITKYLTAKNIEVA